MVAYLLGIAALFTIGTVALLALDFQQVEEDGYSLASSTGSVLFRTIVATRRWNAEHGGVYVPVTDTFLPNPYLDVPDRDVRTTGGVLLTKINPAYMTRLVGERLEPEGYRIHITSLRPLRPANRPADDWERAALEKFEKGARVERGLTGPAGNRTFRYMEPLLTEAACLDCHAKQGYKIGDVRGGIGIAFPYAPFEQTTRRENRYALVAHMVILAGALAVLLLLGRRMFGLVETLQETRRQVSTLEGILPMCANCKKIRKEGAVPSDPKSWVPVDSYITGHSEATFSHGICPECAGKLYGWSGKEKPPDV